MSLRNNKVYIFAIILFIWNILIYYLKNITAYSNIINYIFWIIILIFCLILFKKEYKRDKYKTLIYKDIIMFVLIYIIIYYPLGFIIGFKKSPLSFDFIDIINNIIQYVSLRFIAEIVKYYLIKENNSKLFIIIITTLFIIINIDINYLISLFRETRELFKYISSNIIPIIMYGIVGTYINKNGTLKTNLLLQMTPIIMTYTIPLAPNLDWYLYGVFHIIYLYIIYAYIKYEIEKREETEKKAKESIYSTIPLIIVFTIIILFVLGKFCYVPIGVMSNSMKPIFERGDIVIYKKTKDINEIEKNDIICYQLDDIKVMHRVIKIETINNQKYFTTKGDNLTTKDPLKVKEDQIIGEIEFVIPRLGYPSVWLYEILK